MDFLKLDTNYYDPELADLELVERKGLGHPDTLADALAEVVSTEYSKFCLEKFGAVLHHNVDKLYIGAGHFKIDFGLCEMLKPVQVRINGRMSNSYAGETFDIIGIQERAVLSYLLKVLPHLKEEEIIVQANATQHTKRPYWFSPRNREDIPDFQKPMANDTSVCVSHWPMTISEKLALELERYFWNGNSDIPVPLFHHFGQDIKVMVCRKGKFIDVTMCVPIISTSVSLFSAYQELIKGVENNLNILAREIIQKTEYSVAVKVNPYQALYMLGIGSCIECGEEGIVGRGNSNSGVISMFRPHCIEAAAGKNPVYHTGRVLSFLTMHLAKAIYAELNAKCTVLGMTKNSHTLVPPDLLFIATDIQVDPARVEKIVEAHFISIDYLKCLLSERQVK